MPEVRRIRAKTFYRWLLANFTKSQLVDLANHGADAGWQGLTYTVDLLKLYDRYRDELWRLVYEYAEESGLGWPAIAFLTRDGDNRPQYARFDIGRNEPACPPIDDHDTLATRMVWFAAEVYACRIEAGDPPPEDSL